jgi:transcriptional regulator with XRE-family HTH domain
MAQNINRIKVMLAEKNKTNKWLAEELKKDPATVSKWCTNKMQPGLETLLQIANLLEVDVKELINSSRDDVTYIQITK